MIPDLKLSWPVIKSLRIIIITYTFFENATENSNGMANRRFSRDIPVDFGRRRSSPKALGDFVLYLPFDFTNTHNKLYTVLTSMFLILSDLSNFEN